MLDWIGDGIRTLRGAWNQLGRLSLVAEELFEAGLPAKLNPVVYIPQKKNNLAMSWFLTDHDV